MPVPIGLARQDDDLAVASGDRQDRAHRFETLRIGVPKRIIEDERDATVRSNDHRAGETRDEPELLLGAHAEAFERDRPALQRSVHDAKVIGELHFEARPGLRLRTATTDNGRGSDGGGDPTSSTVSTSKPAARSERPYQGRVDTMGTRFVHKLVDRARAWRHTARRHCDRRLTSGARLVLTTAIERVFDLTRLGGRGTVTGETRAP